MKTVFTLALFAIPALPALAYAQAAPDPVATHTITVEDATKGMKGTGPLVAKLDVEQAGKPFGSFTCELFEKQAPKTVANFVGLARGTRPFFNPTTKAWEKKAFYDGLVFHRVIPDFMVQGGDPLGTGTGNPGYQFEDEFVDTLKMDKPGVLAMANSGPHTNGSQFFITEKATPWLNGRHTIFGQCEPADLVKKMTSVPSVHDRPNETLTIKKVTISRGPAGARKSKK
ncbi:MAG: peptidylprolyl isomerase [Polyangia bacterium]